jgi:hypothetical protein
VRFSSEVKKILNRAPTLDNLQTLHHSLIYRYLADDFNPYLLSADGIEHWEAYLILQLFK